VRLALERYFEFERFGTNWRTEILAGVITFGTMAYIVFVNPSILGDAGMPFASVMAATCIASALGSLLMREFARTRLPSRPAWGSTPISRTPW
jgi:adenine/guanine/hypoxanthine permease